jgi:hypothetical protein
MKWLKRIFWGFVVFMAIVFIAFLFFSKTLFALANPFEPPEMAAAKYAARDVVGDLGGVPVTIPRHFGNYVEYVDDPGFGEKRKDPKPQRTHQSKLRSFGYYTRFPDMAGESSAELIKDKNSYSSSTTPWISVGINAGDHYFGDYSLDRLAQARLEAPTARSAYEDYQQLPNKEYGLTVHAAAGTDPKTNQPYREHQHAEDVFVSRSKSGRVETYIRCSNRHVPAPPCTHYFGLAPEMHADVYLNYRRSQLAHWQEIQEAVRQQILSFKAPVISSAPIKP